MFQLLVLLFIIKLYARSNIFRIGKDVYIVSNAMQHHLFSEHNERPLTSIYLIEWESMLYSNI